MGFTKKALGLALLVGGLIIIFYSLYSSYNIFNAKKEAPVIFEMAEQLGVKSESTQDLQTQLQNVVGEQIKGLLPADSTAKLFNLIAWSIFAGIFIVGGTQISSLGIKLLR